MTLEEQLEEQAKRGLMSLGLEEDTADTWGPWAALAAQFIPGVGEGVGVDLTRDAIQDERYGDAAIEGGLTLLGAVPIVGDFAAAAIKGIRRAPTSLLDDAVDAGKKVEFDEAAWLKENPRPYPGVMPKDMTPEQHREWKRHASAKTRAKNLDARRAQDREAKKRSRENPEVREAQERRRREKYANDPDYREKRKQIEKERYANDPEARERALESARRRAEGLAGTPEGRALYRAKSARQRSALLQRTPQHADREKIDEIYRSAVDASVETGIPHHVDHVIPLQGKRVSGLHHQDNLLVVPEAENLSKGNKFEPGDLPPRAGVRKSRAYLKKIREAQEAARRK